MAINPGKIRAGQAYVELSVDKSKMVSGLANVQSMLRNFGQSLKGVGADMLMLGGAVSIPLKYAVQSFASFDDGMRALQAISGATAVQMKGLTTYIRNLGATTAFTSQQVAEGAVNLARMGFNAGGVRDGLKPVMDLTRSTGTEINRLAEVSQFAASALNAFNMPTQQFSRVCDIMAMGANKSAMSIFDMGEALKTAGPIAKISGESLEDTTAILMTLAKSGIRGSLAGTSLRKFYQSLAAQAADSKTKTKSVLGAKKGFQLFSVQEQKAAKDGANELKKLGISVVNMETGNLRKAADIIGELAVAVKGMGNAEKINLLTKIFDIRGSLGATAMLQNIKEVKKFREELAGSAGYAANTASSMEAGVGGAIRFLISQFQDFNIELGKVVSEAVLPFTASIKSAFFAAKKFLNNHKELVGRIAVGLPILAAAGVAFLGLGMALKTVAFAIGAVIAPLKVMFSVLKLLKFSTSIASTATTAITALVTLSKTAWVASAAFTHLGASATIGWLGVTGPAVMAAALVGSFVVVINSLTESIKVAVSYFKQFGNTATMVMADAKEALIGGDFIGAVKLTTSGALVVWEQFVMSIKDIWVGLQVEITNIFIKTCLYIIRAIRNVGNGIKALFSKNGFVDWVNGDIEAERRIGNADKWVKNWREEKLNANASGYKKALDEYGQTKMFAMRYRPMQLEMKKWNKAIDKADKVYGKEKFDKDTSAKDDYDKIASLLQTDSDLAKSMAKERADASNEAAAEIRDKFDEALQKAAADRVFTDAERKELQNLSDQFGKAKYLSNAYAELSTAAGATDDAMSKNGNGGSTYGAWTSKVLDAMLGGGGSVAERTAKATEESVKQQKKTNQKLEQIAQNGAVYV